MGGEFSKPSPPESFLYIDFFEKFSLWDICRLDDYQRRMSAQKGLDELASKPLPKWFVDKFPDDSEVILNNDDSYDGMMSPDDKDIEELIYEDDLLRLLVGQRHRLGDSKGLSVTITKLDLDNIEQLKEGYKKAIYARRSALAYQYLFGPNSFTPVTYANETLPEELVGVADARTFMAYLRSRDAQPVGCDCLSPTGTDGV